MSMSCGYFSRMARTTCRPIRPKPLIPTRIVMGLSPSSVRYHAPNVTRLLTPGQCLCADVHDDKLHAYECTSSAWFCQWHRRGRHFIHNIEQSAAQLGSTVTPGIFRVSEIRFTHCITHADFVIRWGSRYVLCAGALSIWIGVVCQHNIEQPTPYVLFNRHHVIGNVETGGLALLRCNIAYVYSHRVAGADSLRNATHQQVRQNTRVQTSGADHQ